MAGDDNVAKSLSLELQKKDGRTMSRAAKNAVSAFKDHLLDGGMGASPCTKV